MPVETVPGAVSPRGPAIASVEWTSSFRRLIERHRTRPGRPAEAARKAERILSALAAGRGLCPWEAGSLTRWGDARVRGGVKFELGGGYRLICRRRGATLLALFLGNDEECHSWLRVSRGVEDAVGTPGKRRPFTESVPEKSETQCPPPGSRRGPST